MKFSTCVFSAWVFAAQAAVGATCPVIPQAANSIADPLSYATTAPFGLDAEGVLVRDYGSQYDGLGKFRNPLFIANYALGLYRVWVEGGCTDDHLRSQFLVQSEWYRSNAVWRDGAAVWVYPFRNDFYNLAAGWISGITQSKVASVLFRAAEVSGDDDYRPLAEAALFPYRVEITEGGVISTEGRAIWIEEAPDPRGKVNKILNGHITALEGILDVAPLSEQDFSALIEGAIEAVRRDLPLFDAGFLSYYSAAPFENGYRPLANRADYNSHHVTQLKWLYELAGDPTFLEWAARFEGFDKRRDTLDAESSVDPVNHGPGEATALYYDHYWSSQMPTWISANYKSPEWVVGLHVGALIAESAPRHLIIEMLDPNGSWRRVKELRDNDEKDLVVMFEEPFETSQLRMRILSNNGHGNVALQSFSPILGRPGAYAVDPANWAR